ncbi:MAG: hypothetical protein QUS33_05710 [Dehalococcoidia bacterium]|nr:hypothetical protein [Dehalococcoidia bacterium]
MAGSDVAAGNAVDRRHAEPFLESTQAMRGSVEGMVAREPAYSISAELDKLTFHASSS